MENDRDFYARRAAEERKAAERAITPEARARHEQLAESYEARAAESDKARAE